MKLAFVGGGAMGEAIIAAVLTKGLAVTDDVTACDILETRRTHLTDKYGIRTSDKGAKVIAGTDLIVLAVKPQEFMSVSHDLSECLNPDQTVLSIMAGVRIETLREALNHKAIVRAIPNTPAQISEGVSVWTSTAETSAEGREAARNVLVATGQEIYVADEKYIDMATAVSSSGPAYVFLVMEAFIDAAVHIGLRRDMAEAMVIQTVIGSARYAQLTGKHLAELRNQVTSPGGTTAEGLLALEQAGIRVAFVKVIEAAYTKAKELGG